jgi:hypothetical protein
MMRRDENDTLTFKVFLRRTSRWSSHQFRFVFRSLSLTSLPGTSCPHWGFHCFLAVADIVVGPHLLSGMLTAQQYRNYRETVLPGLLENMPLAVRQRLWFQHDWAPAHFAEHARQWLNATYSGRWIGCRRPIARPPRSPELNLDGLFPMGTHEGTRLCSLFQDSRRASGKIQAAVTTVDATY